MNNNNEPNKSNPIDEPKGETVPVAPAADSSPAEKPAEKVAATPKPVKSDSGPEVSSR